jgi:hypothetical protein
MNARDMLPDCMMPDGAEPCLAYRQALEIRDDLVAALQPFERLLRRWDRVGRAPLPDDQVVATVGDRGDYATVTLGDLRRAAAALAKAEDRQP